MPRLTEKHLTFEFPDTWEVSKYDEWPYYRNRFIGISTNTKAVDVVAYDPGGGTAEQGGTAWLIEVKDYRVFETRDRALWDTVASKVRDSLAGIAAQAFRAEYAEQALAKRVLRAACIRVVLHLEQVRTPSKLFPQAYNRADVTQRLRQRLRSVDPRARVCDASTENVPWRVTLAPAPR